MKIPLAALLLCLTPLSAHGQADGKTCENFQPDKDPKKWTWMDRQCKIHPRGDLDAILKSHQQWIKEHWNEIQDLASGRIDYLSSGALHDPKRADLRGAKLIHAGLRSADLIAADLSYADLTDAWFLQADLTGINLTNADLSRADFTGANLTRAALQEAFCDHAWFFAANLTKASFSYNGFHAADLTRAHLNGADLTRAHLSNVDLTGAMLIGAYLYGANLRGAHLAGAGFSDADLTGTILRSVDATGAYLNSADLSEADCYLADLSETKLILTVLNETELGGAELWNALFEPKDMPPVNSIARAKGLQTLRWVDRDLRSGEELPFTESPTPAHLLSNFWGTSWRDIRSNLASRWRALFKPQDTKGVRASGEGEQTEYTERNEYPIRDLRKALHDAGYREAEAEVNLAYHRRTQKWWGILLFDWTCAWGADWARPIWIILALGAICALVYWSLLRFGRRKRLLAGQSHRVRKGRIRPRRPSQLFVVARKFGRERQWPVGRDFAPLPWFWLPRPRRKHWVLTFPLDVFHSVWARLRWELLLFVTASLFSVMSVLNLGVQGLDIGRWFRLMQSRDFDLKARGTLRLLAGFQSVASFLLLALTAYILLVQPIGE